MSSSQTLRGKIQTVSGLIEPLDLGWTLIHEHVLCDVTPPSLANSGEPEVEITLENVWEVRYHWSKHLGNSRLNEQDVAILELRRMREKGGQSLVELSNGGTRRNPEGLLRVSRESGIQMIMGCGYYIEEFLPRDTREKTVEAMAREMISDVVAGADGTDVCSGIIGEIGCSSPWTDFEKKVMHAAVIAQQETGAAVTIHPGRHPDAPREILRFIGERGGDSSRTIMGHIDRTLFELDRLLNLLETGCSVAYDFFGIESSYYPFQEIDLPNDGMRLNFIRALIDRGHLSQVLMSHDICTKTRLVHYGGHGYGHIFANIIPMMRRKGFSDSEIESILVKNPSRLLTFA